jgi:hypothetical protein
MMSQIQVNKNQYAGLIDHVNVALVILFIGLLIGTFLQWRYYMREGANRTEMACVKAIGFDWKYGRRNYEYGRVTFQFANGMTAKAHESWISIKPASGHLEKSRLEKEWLQSSCFRIWFEKGKEADARIEQIKPPFMSLGGSGQWCLLALALLLAVRGYVRAKL